MLFLDSLAFSCEAPAMTLDIKICGLKTPEAVGAALAGGASHIGFIFFARSPRHVEPEDAARLREAARGKALAVAVTVDAEDAVLERIVSIMQPDMLQLHGKEPPERVAAIKARSRLPIVTAFPISEAADLLSAERYSGIVDRYPSDANPAECTQLPGGNGVFVDRPLLAAVPAGTDYFLSGGLNGEIVGQAVRAARP